MDNKYSAQRKEENLVKPHNVTEGLKEGAKHLGKGFFEGFSGILTQVRCSEREERLTRAAYIWVQRRRSEGIG